MNEEGNSTSASDVAKKDSGFEDGCDAEVATRFDVEAIKEAVTVHDVLGLDATAKSIECPIHQGARKSFSIWDEGRAWTCHADCGETGDVITLWQRLHGGTARAAIEALAQLAEVEPGTVSMPMPRRPPRTKPTISPRDPRLRSAMLAWDALRTGRGDDERDDLTWAEREYRSRNRGRLLAEAEAKGMNYLASRGLSGLPDALGPSGPFYYLCFRRDGSPSTPIYTRERVTVYRTAAIINIATRIIAPSPTGPKVLVMADHPTKFCFGRVDPLLTPLERVVLVEGLMDYLTALLLWPPGWRTRTCGGTLVLGAHSVGQVVPIVEGLLDDEQIGPLFRRLPLTLIPHADPAGAKAHAAALALCALHAVKATTFDLAGCGDLNEWINR